MIFLSVVLFYFGSAAPVENALELEEIFLDIRSIRGPRESISESSGDHQEPLQAERSLLKINGEIVDQDSAENGSGDASIRSLFQFEGSGDLALTGLILPFNESSGDGIDERSLFSEGSADLALTGFMLPYNESSGDGIDERSLYGSGDLALTGLILPYNESSGDGIDERSLYSEGSGVAERALVFISEESGDFSGDNEEEIVDPRSLVTPNPLMEEVFTIYDYYSGDEADDDEAEDRSLLTDIWQVAQQADDMLNRVIEEPNNDEDSSFQKIYLSLAVSFIFMF